MQCINECLSPQSPFKIPQQYPYHLPDSYERSPTMFVLASAFHPLRSLEESLHP